MRKERSDVAVLLQRIAEALGEAFSGDARLHAAVATLQKADLSVTVRLELRSGRGEPMVVVDGSHVTMPEWSRADRELLRSLGIDAETDDPHFTREAKSRRRQPR